MPVTKEQLYLDNDLRPADEPPEVPEVRDAIHAWLDAKDEQARASLRTRAAGDSAMLKLAEHDLESHPYIDPKTGKRKHFVRDTTPKPKTMSTPRRNDRDDGPGDEVEADERPDPAKVFGEDAPLDDKVEKRRVSRTSVEKEIDPFAAVRGAMGGDGTHDEPTPEPAKKKGKAK